MDQTKKLHWFLTFIYQNFDELSQAEKVKTFYEVFYTIYARGFHTSAKQPAGTLLSHLLSREPITNLDFKKISEAIKELQETIKTWLSLLVEKGEKEKFINLGTMKGELVVSYDEGKFYQTFHSNEKDQIVYEFTKALDGVPLTALKRCKGCERYFLHLSSRKKDYCTPHCTWRARARMEREENPEAYREKQRKKMREYYKRKKQEEIGPKVKVGRKTK